jgi:hypothetical protein
MHKLFTLLALLALKRQGGEDTSATISPKSAFIRVHPWLEKFQLLHALKPPNFDKLPPLAHAHNSPPRRTRIRHRACDQSLSAKSLA